MSLAFLGGQPAFDQPLAVGMPAVEPATRERYLALMGEVFDRNWLTNDGPLVRRLEAEVARLHAVDHCVLVCNATIAQMLVLRALELTGAVVVPSFTFVATAHACRMEGLDPVFCDVSPTTLMAGPEEVERALTPATRSVVPVHLFGNVCDVAGLEQLAARRSLALVFDAAHAFACFAGDVPVGRFGRAEILSFHATKAFSTFEGGAVLTNDASLDARLRHLRNFGFRGYDDVAWLGLNGKMSEAQAAFGLASLPELEARRARGRAVYDAYRRALADVPGVRVLPVGEQGVSNHHYVPVLLDPPAFGLSRDRLYRVLWAENVLARRYFHPGVHRMDAYAPAKGGPPPLPVTEDVSARILCLPAGFARPDETVERVVAVVREARAEAPAIRRKAEA
ncbi:MAG: DegT/DnrJ/EryC1/StrS family aminotransferase [Vicinamibacteria bacterium]